MAQDDFADGSQAAFLCVDPDMVPVVRQIGMLAGRAGNESRSGGVQVAVNAVGIAAAETINVSGSRSARQMIRAFGASSSGRWARVDPRLGRVVAQPIDTERSTSGDSASAGAHCEAGPVCRSAHSDPGVCDNGRTIKRVRLEEGIFAGLKDRLMASIPTLPETAPRKSNGWPRPLTTEDRNETAHGIRGRDERVTLTPRAKRVEVYIMLHGEFGGILEWLTACDGKRFQNYNSPGACSTVPGVSSKLAAGQDLPAAENGSRCQCGAGDRDLSKRPFRANPDDLLKRWNTPRSKGSTGSITVGCWSLSATSRLPKLKNDIMPYSTKRA